MGSMQELSLRPEMSCEGSVPAGPPDTAEEGELRSALQQLAERAQYITGASGIAIALREPGNTQMVCEASAGRTAPEVGARLHVESGITAECVRTKKILRCDQASSDSRVNVESCRALGIESVLVLPLILGDFVVGILELFGEEPAAFQERDVKTLEQVGEMVEKLVLRRMQASVRTDWVPQAASIMRVCPEEVPACAEIDTEGEMDSRPVPPLPSFLTQLAAEAEEPRSRHWGTWLRQSRR